MPGPRIISDAPGTQQQHQQQHSVPSTTPKTDTSSQHPVFPATPKGPPQWYDKIIDALIGEDGLETKYALICHHCFAHNGLILPNEVDTIRKSSKR
jgi:hypothetical protein